MSIQVNDFQWEPGKNDAEYIKLLKSSRDEWQKIAQKAIAKLKALSKAQEPRVMKVTEVTACEVSTVLWVEERQGVTWNLFPLEIDVSSTHPDTGTNYLFFITYHDIRKFECDKYNRTWRCWTSRPTDAQREAIPWG